MSDQLILIIEDNERNLKLVRDVLQYNGFRTVEARTAEDGLVLANARPTWCCSASSCPASTAWRHSGSCGGVRRLPTSPSSRLPHSR
jgi:CheY-like chemotaxis protein